MIYVLGYSICQPVFFINVVFNFYKYIEILNKIAILAFSPHLQKQFVHLYCYSIIGFLKQFFNFGSI